MRPRRSTLAAMLLLALAGCDDEPIRVGRGMGPSGTAATGQAMASGAQADGADAGTRAGAADRQYRDEDFVEAETNRDPFRNYAASFQAVAAAQRAETTRPVKLSETSIDEMRLIGIVSGVPDARAMIVDREGVGHTVRRGEFVGRGEVVQAGGIDALPVTLHWRVERIRPAEIVLTREDPTAPNRPPLTRVLPLREREDDVRSRQR